jgi:hypothetical protein
MRKPALLIVAGVIIAFGLLAFFERSRSPEAPAGGPAAPTPMASGETELPAGHPPITAAPEVAEGMDFSSIALPGGGKRIETLYAEKQALAGQEVIVRGKVTKFTPGVMGKNWIHIMDGTGEEGMNDLTVTTDAQVQLGDLVLVRGVLNTDQDFGFGYAYEILVENAHVEVE